MTIAQPGPAAPHVWFVFADKRLRMIHTTSQPVREWYISAFVPPAPREHSQLSASARPSASSRGAASGGSWRSDCSWSECTPFRELRLGGLGGWVWRGVVPRFAPPIRRPTIRAIRVDPKMELRQSRGRVPEPFRHLGDGRGLLIDGDLDARSPCRRALSARQPRRNRASSCR
jgi:hypothetical protein